MPQPLLTVTDLQVHFSAGRGGPVPAVDGVSLAISEGEVLGVVGESGCGKSVTSLSIMGLIPSPPGKIAGGEIIFKGENLLATPEKRMRTIRGNEIAMIFQEPMSSLNPVFTVGNQISEAIIIHQKVTKKQAWQMAIEMIKKVGIPRAEQIVAEYPHQLSGGMRQRVMIAMAMACQPKLLIADEPTTALDVTIQAQILDLMKQLNQVHRTAIMLITHDLGVVAEICHRVVVMYAGKVVETGAVSTILKNPRHPYTMGLINSLPKLNEQAARLYSIPGNVPKPGSILAGCRFAPRCHAVMAACGTSDPDLVQLAPSHQCRCFLFGKEGGVQVG